MGKIRRRKLRKQLSKLKQGMQIKPKINLFEVIENDPNDNNEPKTDIISINDNCIEEILEWLSLSDLVSLSTTCKRMKELVSRYFGRKYPTKQMIVKMGSNLRGEIEYWPRELYVQRFHEYIKYIVIQGRQPAIFRHVGTFCDKTPKTLRIVRAIGLTEMHGKCIEELLAHVEIVEFVDCSFATEFYDSFLKYCLNLKQLVIKSFAECTHKGTKNQWLLHKYPHLKHLTWSFDDYPPEELKTFFHQNPNVQSFAVDKFALDMTKLIMNTGIKVEKLCLDICFSAYNNSRKLFQSVEMLHKQGQFKRLQLITTFTTLQTSTFYKGEYIEALMVYKVFEILSIAMTNLKVLYLHGFMCRSEARTLVQNFPNLEEISVYPDCLGVILPFICHSAKLKKIYVNQSSYMRRINLNRLRKERAKLKNACPLTIYLEEELFVNVKFEEDDLKQGLVEIKRAESHFVNNALIRSMMEYSLM